MKLCQFQGDGCLRQFEPKSPNQKNCDVCQKPAKRARNLAHALAAYRADPEKYRKRRRQQRAKDPEAARTAARLYHAANRERINATERAQRLRNGKKYAAKQRARYAANPEKQRAIAKRSREKHKPEILRRDRERAKRQRELVAKAQKILEGFDRGAAKAPAKRGPKRKSEASRKYFKVGNLVEENLASGMELTAARRLVAKTAKIAYLSVVRYHMRFRKGLAPPHDKI